MSRLQPFGISVRSLERLDDALNWTYRRSNGTSPPTPLLFDDNPFQEDLRAARRVLEVGCGCGRNVPGVMTAAPLAVYEGVDPNPQMLKHFPAFVKRAEWLERCHVQSDFTTCGAEFDLALTTFVFQHIGFRPPKPQLDVAGISRHVIARLRPGGVWLLFEHDVEEAWIERWMKDTRVRPQVWYPRYAGFPELNDRGQVHHLMIWKKPAGWIDDAVEY